MSGPFFKAFSDTINEDQRGTFQRPSRSKSALPAQLHNAWDYFCLQRSSGSKLQSAQLCIWHTKLSEDQVQDQNLKHIHSHCTSRFHISPTPCKAPSPRLLVSHWAFRLHRSPIHSHSINTFFFPRSSSFPIGFKWEVRSFRCSSKAFTEDDDSSYEMTNRCCKHLGLLSRTQWAAAL